MGCIFCKTDPGQYLLPTIKKAD
jgi:WD40 repeat protein